MRHFTKINLARPSVLAYYKCLFTYVVEFFRDVFALLLRLFQLLALLQQLRPLDVRHQNRLQGRVVCGHHLLLAVEDVDVWRDLEGAGSDVAEQGGFAVAIGANQSIPAR